MLFPSPWVTRVPWWTSTYSQSHGYIPNLPPGSSPHIRKDFSSTNGLIINSANEGESCAEYRYKVTMVSAVLWLALSNSSQSSFLSSNRYYIFFHIYPCYFGSMSEWFPDISPSNAGSLTSRDRSRYESLQLLLSSRSFYNRSCRRFAL